MSIKEQIKLFFNPGGLTVGEYIAVMIGALLFIIIASLGG